MKQFRFPAHYNQAVASAALENIALVKLGFDIQPGYFGENRALNFALAAKPAVTHDATSGMASAIFHWRVEAEQAGKAVLSLDAHFVVLMSGLVGVSHEAVEAFARRFGVFASFPYFRSLVSELSWISGANLPILPIFKESERQPSSPTAESATTPGTRARQRRRRAPKHK
jgi:hypothetical protein